MRNKRRMILGLALAIGCLVLSVPALSQTVTKHEAESTAKQSLEFGPTGTIHIVDSLGVVKVEGWDKDEVELTVTKKTQKTYEPKNLAKAAKDLERIKVEMHLVSENTLLAINTNFPSRTPTRLLRGKTNVNLEYLIKVPSRSTLLIKHDIGEVEVTNVFGDIEATSRIGEIRLKLPEEQQYSVDARVKLGDVSSEFGTDSQRQGPLSVGAKLTGEPAAPTRQIFLRLGIGDIQVTRLRAEKSGE